MASQAAYTPLAALPPLTAWALALLHPVNSFSYSFAPQRKLSAQCVCKSAGPNPGLILKGEGTHQDTLLWGDGDLSLSLFPSLSMSSSLSLSLLPPAQQAPGRLSTLCVGLSVCSWHKVVWGAHQCLPAWGQRTCKAKPVRGCDTRCLQAPKKNQPTHNQPNKQKHTHKTKTKTQHSRRWIYLGTLSGSPACEFWPSATDAPGRTAKSIKIFMQIDLYLHVDAAVF